MAAARASRSVPARVIACYVVANEAEHLAESLRSVKAYVDGYVIVDSLFTTNPLPGTHSSDATRAVAEAVCAPLPLTYIESDERLTEPQARNRYLSETEGDWCLMLDGDEQLYGEYADILRLMERVRYGRIPKAVDVPVYTVAVNFNGNAPEMSRAEYERNPLISTMGYQPRLFHNVGLHYDYDAGRGFGGALLDGSGYLQGRRKASEMLIINHHVRQSFESYQNDFTWEHGTRL